MKKIKKTVCAVFVLLLLTLNVSGVSAKSYWLSDVGFTIDIPDDFVIFTRGMDRDDPAFTKYGYSYDYIMNYLEESDALKLDALRLDGTGEFYIAMESNISDDFSALSDDELYETIAGLDDYFVKELGVTQLKESNIYKHSEAKYIMLEYKQNMEGTYVAKIQYYTVFDHKAVNVVYSSYLGEISQNDEKMMQHLIDSIFYDTPLRTAPVNAARNTTERLSEAGRRGAITGIIDGLFKAILFGAIVGIVGFFKRKKKDTDNNSNEIAAKSCSPETTDNDSKNDDILTETEKQIETPEDI